MNGSTIRRWSGRAALFACASALALCMGELVTRRVHDRDAPATKEQMDCRTLDPLLGGGFKPDCSTKWKKWSTAHESRMLYDVQFTTDHWGHRVVPGGKTAGRFDQVIFFGCSFTLGAGVNDDETLPARFARHAANYEVHNFAGSGFGPQQMLAMLTQTDLAPFGVKAGKRIAVYVFLDFHVSRAAGTYDVVGSYGRFFPYYRLGPGGVPIFAGSFSSGRPWRTRFYDLLARYDLALPRLLLTSWKTGDADDELAAAIIRSSAETFVSRFEGDAFYVVVYPGRTYSPVIPSLAGKVRILDYSGLVDMTAAGTRIPGDPHPSARVHDAVARRLAADLAVD